MEFCIVGVVYRCTSQFLCVDLRRWGIPSNLLLCGMLNNLCLLVGFLFCPGKEWLNLLRKSEYPDEHSAKDSEDDEEAKALRIYDEEMPNQVFKDIWYLV